MNRLARTIGITVALAAPVAAQHVHSPAGSSPPAGQVAPASIRLDARQRQMLGLTYGTAARRAVEKIIHTVGRLDYDERRLTTVTVKVGGYVEQLFADFTGKTVRQGEPLFSLYSPELVTAEREYLTARRTAAEMAGASLEEARASATALLGASHERLRRLDLDDGQVHALEQRDAPARSEAIRAPASGTIVEKMITAGQRVEPGMPLYKIADLSTLWVYADVYEYELPFVAVGQEARLTLSYFPGAVFSARATYISPTLDAKSRTAKVRFELANQGEHVLRPEMYANVELHVPAGERLVVPATAIFDSGNEQAVFVTGDEGRLEQRPVRVGGRFGNDIEILDGLDPGTSVVTSANFLLDSETKLRGAESMMGMMGEVGMADRPMESARPMDMSESGTGPNGYQEKQVGDLRVMVFPAYGVATVGTNPIRVRIRDTAGTPITGADVGFTYTMDMPGMQIATARTRDVGAGVYEGSAELAMAGPWGLVVSVEAAGHAPLSEKFVLRVAP
jgi:Cu(I)/Ag(I) efflux system membrane fusion protein